MMKKTEMSFLLTDCIIAGLVAKMTPWEAKGLILFMCIFTEIIFTVFILLSLQLKFTEKEIN